MLRRGQIQLRGRIRWKARRVRLLLRQGSRRVGQSPIVFGNAIPKSGSKLLFNILQRLPRIGPFVDTGLNEIKPFSFGLPTDQAWINSQLDSLSPGDIRLGYLYAVPESVRRLVRPGWASFFLIRDPRDTLVSEVFYALDLHPGHALHDHLSALPGMEARLKVLIEGIPSGPRRRVGVREHFDRFLPWLEHPEVCVLRYEQIIEDPPAALGRIVDHLEGRGLVWDTPRARALEVLRGGMDPARSSTFREGRSGGWRNHFTAANRRQFQETAGDLLERLGYPAAEPR